MCCSILKLDWRCTGSCSEIDLDLRFLEPVSDLDDVWPIGIRYKVS